MGIAKAIESQGVFRGRPPSFFQQLCRGATRGGNIGYDGVGYELTRHLPEPDELTSAAWRKQMQLLAKLLDGEDVYVIQWLYTIYPSFMELVPTRRRGQFVAGMRQCVEDEKAAWM